MKKLLTAALALAGLGLTFGLTAGPASSATTITNLPSRPASIMWGPDSRQGQYAHPGAVVSAGRTNYNDKVFHNISAAGGTELIYLDPVITNSYGRYATLLDKASACGPAVPQWGSYKANSWGNLNDIRVGGVLQSKLACVLNTMLKENPQMGGVFLDDVGSRSWFPNLNWSTMPSADRQAYRAGMVQIVKTVANVLHAHGLIFLVNGTWTAGTLASNGGGWPTMSTDGNALADGGVVEHHDGQGAYWAGYARSPQWASQSTVTQGQPFMWAIMNTAAGLTEFKKTGAFALISQQTTSQYNFSPVWGPFRATGLASRVG